VKFLEDFKVGQIFAFRTPPLSKDEIISFAREWDPQRLHTDEYYAKQIHGGLIASGFQTLLLVFRPIMRDFMTGVANIGGLGFERLSWNAPVRANEPLDVTLKMQAVRPSQTKPDRGVISYRVEARNMAGEPVLTVDTAAMVKRKAAPAS
jgi:acyl dehydratase